MEIVIAPRRSGTIQRAIARIQQTNPKRIKKTAIVVHEKYVQYILDKKDLVIITHQDFIKGNYNKRAIHELYIFQINDLLQTIATGEEWGPEVTKLFVSTNIISI